MSYLLFMDESGHDHKNMPYEVRGGVSIASINVFKFLCDLQNLKKKFLAVSYLSLKPK